MKTNIPSIKKAAKCAFSKCDNGNKFGLFDLFLLASFVSNNMPGWQQPTPNL